MRRLLILVLLLLSLRAQAAPDLDFAARRGRVTVYAEKGLEALGADLANSAETELRAIAEDLIDLPVPTGIEVRLVTDASSLPLIAPQGRGAPQWAIGVAYPDLGIISVATRRGANLADPTSTLRHELAHIALGAALGDRAPHWLHEGFAYQHSAEWSWDRTETLSGMAWFGGIIELDDLDRSFPAEESPANRAYAESYDFVGFLSRRGRYGELEDRGDRYPFRHFLSELGHGRSLDAAAVKAFGKPIHALFGEWHEDLTTRYLTAPIGLLALGLWVVCALLLVIGYLRRRRQNRRRMDKWDEEDRIRAAALRNHPVIVPPYIAWPGDDDPLREPEIDDEKPDGLVN